MFSFLSLNGRKIYTISFCWIDSQKGTIFAQLVTVNLTRETLLNGEGPYIEASTKLQAALLLTGSSDKKLIDEVTLDSIC